MRLQAKEESWIRLIRFHCQILFPMHPTSPTSGPNSSGLWRICVDGSRGRYGRYRYKCRRNRVFRMFESRVPMFVPPPDQWLLFEGGMSVMQNRISSLCRIKDHIIHFHGGTLTGLARTKTCSLPKTHKSTTKPSGGDTMVNNRESMTPLNRP